MSTPHYSLSIVIPVYNEEENVAALASQVHDALSAMGRDYEVLLVDDGSSDSTWDRLLDAAKKYPCFRLIRFRRNFGQTAAMSAGIDAARNDVIVTLDADLQNDPRDIPHLLEVMESDDCAVVSGWRKDRKDAFINRRLPSMIANGLISKITGVHLHDYGCTLKAYKREVLQGIRLYGEMHRFIPALCSWVGGRIEEVVVDHHPRTAGKSKYGIGRTFRVVLDLLTVKFLLRFTGGPMQLFGKFAFLFGGIGLLMMLLVAGDRLFYGGPDITHQQFRQVFLTQQPALFHRFITNPQQTPPARFYAGILVLEGQTGRILIMKQRQRYCDHLAIFDRFAWRFADPDARILHLSRLELFQRRILKIYLFDDLN